MACDAPPKRKNWRLYHLLDFKPPVSTTEVKHTARKATLRTQFYQAYQTLSQIDRKHFYDCGGEAAYGFISSGTWGPLIPAMGISAYIIMYFLVLLIEVCLLIAFFVLLGLRADDHISVAWNLVLVPLEIFGCIMVLVCFVAIFINWFSPEGEAKLFSKLDRVSPVGNFLAACAYAAVFFLIAYAVNQGGGKKYILYLIAPMAGDSIYYLTSFLWRWPTFVKRLMKFDGNSPSPIIYYGIFLMGFLQWFCGVCQWVVLGLKLDGKLDGNWYLIFIPFGIRAFLRLVEALLRSLLRRTQLVRGVLGVAFDVIGSFFSNGMLIISLYFVGVRIERGKDRVPMPVALIPVYLHLLYMFICLFITLFYVLRKVKSLDAQEIRLNHLFSPATIPEDKYFVTDREAYQPMNDTSDSSFPSKIESKAGTYDPFDSPSRELVSPVLHHSSKGSPHSVSHDPFSQLADEERAAGPATETDSDPYDQEDDEEFSDASFRTNSSTEEKKEGPAATEEGEDDSYEYVEETAYEDYTEDVTPQSREQQMAGPPSKLEFSAGTPSDKGSLRDKEKY